MDVHALRPGYVQVNKTVTCFITMKDARFTPKAIGVDIRADPLYIDLES